VKDRLGMIRETFGLARAFSLQIPLTRWLIIDASDPAYRHL
jgi:hypothetical protein